MFRYLVVLPSEAGSVFLPDVMLLRVLEGPGASALSQCFMKHIPLSLS